MNLNEKLMSSSSVANASSINFNTTTNNNSSSSDAQNKTMWNWFTKNRLVNTIVEKVVTTVDPQMREFIRKDFLLLNFRELT
jgi:hypothetical protein